MKESTSNEKEKMVFDDDNMTNVVGGKARSGNCKKCGGTLYLDFGGKVRCKKCGRRNSK